MRVFENTNKYLPSSFLLCEIISHLVSVTTFPSITMCDTETRCVRKRYQTRHKRKKRILYTTRFLFESHAFVSVIHEHAVYQEALGE